MRLAGTQPYDAVNHASRGAGTAAVQNIRQRFPLCGPDAKRGFLLQTLPRRPAGNTISELEDAGAVVLDLKNREDRLTGKVAVPLQVEARRIEDTLRLPGRRQAEKENRQENATGENPSKKRFVRCEHGDDRIRVRQPRVR